MNMFIRKFTMPTVNVSYFKIYLSYFISFGLIFLFISMPFWEIRKFKKYLLLTESHFLSFFLFVLFVTHYVLIQLRKAEFSALTAPLLCDTVFH